MRLNNTKVVKSISLKIALLKKLIIPITLDKRYKVPTLNDWKRIIQYYRRINASTYIPDFFDCENFALVFSAMVPKQFKINSAGIAFGTVYDKSTGKKLGEHAYNVLAYMDNCKLDFLLFEPQTYEYTRLKRTTELVGWIYKTKIAIFG